MESSGRAGTEIYCLLRVLSLLSDQRIHWLAYNFYGCKIYHQWAPYTYNAEHYFLYILFRKYDIYFLITPPIFLPVLFVIFVIIMSLCLNNNASIQCLWELHNIIIILILFYWGIWIWWLIISIMHVLIFLISAWTINNNIIIEKTDYKEWRKNLINWGTQLLSIDARHALKKIRESGDEASLFMSVSMLDQFLIHSYISHTGLGLYTLRMRIYWSIDHGCRYLHCGILHACIHDVSRSCALIIPCNYFTDYANKLAPATPLRLTMCACAFFIILLLN